MSLVISNNSITFITILILWAPNAKTSPVIDPRYFLSNCGKRDKFIT